MATRLPIVARCCGQLDVIFLCLRVDVETMLAAVVVVIVVAIVMVTMMFLLEVGATGHDDNGSGGGNGDVDSGDCGSAVAECDDNGSKGGNGDGDGGGRVMVLSVCLAYTLTHTWTGTVRWRYFDVDKYIVVSCLQ